MRSRGTAFSSTGCTRAPPGPAGTDAAPTETAEGPGGAGAAAGAGAAGLALPDSNAARMSFLLTRPPAPLPAMPARSTWCSFARRRTRGELRTSLPLPRPAGAALVGGGGWGAAATGATGVAGAVAVAGGAGAAALGVSGLCDAGAGAGAGAGAPAGAAARVPTAADPAATGRNGTVLPSADL